MEGVSTTAPIRRLARSIFASVFFAPYSVKLPPVGACKPQMRRMSVALPAPFLPTKPVDRTFRDVHVQTVQRRKITITLGESIGFKHIFHVRHLLCLTRQMVSGKVPEGGQENCPEIIRILFLAGSRYPRPLPHSRGRMRCAACSADCRCAF